MDAQSVSQSHSSMGCVFYGVALAMGMIEFRSVLLKLDGIMLKFEHILLI